MYKKPFFKSFVWRFHRTTFFIIVVCLLVSMGLIAFSNYTQTLDRLENRAQSTVKLASVSLRNALADSDQGALMETVEALLENNDIVAIKVLPNNTETNILKIKETVQEHSFDALVYKDGFIASEALVQKDGKGVGKVHLITDARQAIEGSIWHLIVIAVLMVVLILLIGISSWMVFQKSVQPAISDLIENMDQMAKGEIFSMDTNRSDELGDLARQFSSMFSNVQNKIGNLQMVNTTAGLLAMSTDQTRALEIGMEMMQIQTNVKQGSVYLLDTDQKLKVCAYYPKWQGSKPPPSKEFELGEGILGKAAESQEIIYVPDTSKHTEFISKGTSQGDPKALLCIPMADSKEVFGVMNFSGIVGEVRFSREEGDDRVAMTIARLTMLVTKMLSLSNANFLASEQSPKQ